MSFASLGKFVQVCAILSNFGQGWVSLGKFGQVRASWVKLSQLEPEQNKNDTLKILLGKCKWQRKGKK